MARKVFRRFRMNWCRLLAMKMGNIKISVSFRERNGTVITGKIEPVIPTFFSWLECDLCGIVCVTRAKAIRTKIQLQKKNRWCRVRVKTMGRIQRKPTNTYRRGRARALSYSGNRVNGEKLKKLMKVVVAIQRTPSACHCMFFSFLCRARSSRLPTNSRQKNLFEWVPFPHHFIQAYNMYELPVPHTQTHEHTPNKIKPNGNNNNYKCSIPINMRIMVNDLI